MARIFRAAMMRRLKYLFALATLLFTTAGTLLAACTATQQNWDNSPVIGFEGGTPSNTASLTSNINSVGDLVVITAWCFPPSFTGGCTPVSVKLGNQTAVQTSVGGQPDPGTSGTPGSGQGWIYYVLSAAAAGSQTLTFTIVETQQLQVSYMDFKPSAGCTFSHGVDSPRGFGSNVGTSITSPSITPTQGDLLYNFTWTNTHMVDPMGSPWVPSIWQPQNSHFLENSVNAVVYDLSAPSGTIANNLNTLHSSDSWQALITSFSLSGSVTANGCPSGAPVTGNNCYFIAANGSDTNSGTSESSPWLHAPGMPNCKNNCAAVTPTAGHGFIFRGGDTWHFGNSALSPYTGGTWNMDNWQGNEASCVYEGTQTGCIYYGVDKAWFTGGAWTRPILTGDNPTSLSLVPSCAHQIPNGVNGAHNQLTVISRASIFDNFELTGLCSNEPGDPGTSSGHLVYYGNGNGCQTGDSSPACMTFINNVYVHGWTATTTAGTSTQSQPCVLIGGGFNGLQTIDHVVIDGSDSSPGSCGWGLYPSFYHMRDSIIRYTNQGVGQWCHDIHDNIFEFMFNHNPNAGSHSNVLECNNDSTGNALHQPQSTPNVFYNNIVRHFDPNFLSQGQVNLWFCPNTIPEYWFNNTVYDTGGFNDGNFWAIAGSPTYAACTNTGRQFMFNNTLSGGQQPCHLAGSNTTGGQYLTVLNEHLINTPWDGTGCTGHGDASNIAMSWATAHAQGYTTGAAGMSDADTCANDATKPCTPTSAGDSTVNAGGNHQAYCTTLASYSSEYAIGTEAANACKYGTTDGCAYNTSTHTMNCPAQTAIARPASTAWDAGANQFSASQAQAPQPPSNLQAAVQ
jgi:hypothetical protein